MNKKPFLNLIDIRLPCNESWEEMFGNDEVRFCSHCAKNVHNLSSMTRAKAEKLIKDTNGNLCVRYVKNPKGKIITAPPRFVKIKRQATIAASVLASSLALSTLTYAQGEPVKPKEKTNQTQKDKVSSNSRKEDFSTMSGTIMDFAGAVIPGAKIKLIDLKTKESYQIISDDEGLYIFKDLEPSKYKIEIEREGFKKFIIKKFEIGKSINLKKDFILKVNGVVSMGVVLF